MSSPMKLTSSIRQVKPLLSANKEDARRRMIDLYKAWYRYIPVMQRSMDLPITEEQYKAKLREKFLENKHVRDPRVIDLLVVKGQIELKECMEMWCQKSHLARHFKETVKPRPKTFLGKFLDGHDP